MKKIIRFSLVALLACFGSVKSYAGDVKIWADDIAVGAGQITTVKIHAQNLPTDVAAIDICFDLPEGVYIVSQSGDASDLTADYIYGKDDFTAAWPAGAAADFSYTAANAQDGGYIFQVDNAGSPLFKDGDAVASEEGGVLVTFDVATTSGAVSGSIKFANDYSYIGGDISFNDVEVEDAEATVSDKFIVKLPSSGVATICSLVDLDMTGLDAYYVKEIVDKKVKGVKIDGALKALEGAVIQGEAGAVIEIPVATSEAAAPEKNMLVGVTKFTKIGGEGIYFMSGGKFKKAAANGTLAAGKAYLDASKAAKGFDELEFVVEDDATAIKAIETEQNAGVLYNLNGVRVDNPTKGVYIQNGRKVVVK